MIRTGEIMIGVLIDKIPLQGLSIIIQIGEIPMHNVIIVAWGKLNLHPILPNINVFWLVYERWINTPLSISLSDVLYVDVFRARKGQISSLIFFSSRFCKPVRFELGVKVQWIKAGQKVKTHIKNVIILRASRCRETCPFILTAFDE